MSSTGDGHSTGGSRRRYVPLFHRLAVLNALLVVGAVVLTIVVLAPSKLFGRRLDEEVAVLAGVLVLVVLVNLMLLRRVIRPLQALTEQARRVDLAARPAERMPGAEPTSEVGELALTLNEMLERLESERREATGRVLAGQEAERLRIAQELHDQVGQDLTAVLLSLATLQSSPPEQQRATLAEAQEAVRASLEDVRRIALELRPEALDDLGLASALAVLCERFSERSGLQVTHRIAESLPEISPEAELVIYRVAQEALTNIARHSGSDRAQVTLASGGGGVTLAVRDWGRGLPRDIVPGSGIRGMRERAALIGATVEIKNDGSGPGCELRLKVTLEGSR